MERAIDLDEGADAAPREGAVNVGRIERVASLAIGGGLLFYALARRSLSSLGLALGVGAPLVSRGTTGHCAVYEALGIDRSGARVSPLDTIRITVSTTINSPKEEIVPLWRQLDMWARLGRALHREDHALDEATGDILTPIETSHEWEFELQQEKGDEVLVWRAHRDGAFDHTGMLRMIPAPPGRGTEVHLTLGYAAPEGRAGVLLERLVARDPRTAVMEVLRHFKQWVETGEIPTTKGQPSGRERAFTREEQVS